jgi:hypothetical protein
MRPHYKVLDRNENFRDATQLTLSVIHSLTDHFRDLHAEVTTRSKCLLIFHMAQCFHRKQCSEVPCPGLGLNTITTLRWSCLGSLMSLVMIKMRSWSFMVTS